MLPLDFNLYLPPATLLLTGKSIIFALPLYISQCVFMSSTVNCNFSGFTIMALLSQRLVCTADQFTHILIT